MGSIKSYWNKWLWCDATARIITINAIVWMIVGGGLLLVPSIHHVWWVGLFGVPGNIMQWPSRIWTPATYMFSHYDFMHMMVNMVWMLLFGRVLSRVVSAGHVTAAYVLSGLAGAIAFLCVSMALAKGEGILIGASCAVLGVAACATMIVPKLDINLLLVTLPLYVVTLIAVVLVALMQTSPEAYSAHLAGLLAGLFYGLWLRSRQPDSLRIPTHGSFLFPTPKAQAVNREQPRTWHMPIDSSKPESVEEIEAQLDKLLEKVGASGYESLSAAERQRLFELSQKLKR